MCIQDYRIAEATQVKPYSAMAVVSTNTVLFLSDPGRRTLCVSCYTDSDEVPGKIAALEVNIAGVWVPLHVFTQAEATYHGTFAEHGPIITGEIRVRRIFGTAMTAGGYCTTFTKPLGSI